MGRFVWMLLLVFVPSMAHAQLSPPPIGFQIYGLEGTANAETLLSPAFLRRPMARGEISAVSGSTLTLNGQGLDQVIPGVCHIEVQSGQHGGLVSKVVGVDGADLLLEDAVAGVLGMGDYVVVYPFWTLNEVFENTMGVIGSGETPEDSDLVTLIDPVSQVARSYFLKEGAGWREVGDEAAGDRGEVAFPFYQGFFFLRRSPERLDIIVDGRVPFLPHRFQPIHPGRNLITVAIAGTSDLVEDYFFVPGESAFPVQGGTSAADADVIALSSDSRLLPRFYYHESAGWNVIGGETFGSGFGVSLASAADYHRAGPKAFLKVRSLRFAPTLGLSSYGQTIQASGISSSADVAGGPAGGGPVSSDEVDQSAGPAGEIVGPGGEVSGPGQETGGGTPSSPTPGGSEGPMPSSGGGDGPSPGGAAGGKLWGDVSPVLFDGEVMVDHGAVRMRFQWDSEVGRRYGIQFRLVPAEAWAQVGVALTASGNLSALETDVVTDGGEFRVVEIFDEGGDS